LTERESFVDESLKEGLEFVVMSRAMLESSSFSRVQNIVNVLAASGWWDFHFKDGELRARRELSLPERALSGIWGNNARGQITL